MSYLAHLDPAPTAAPYAWIITHVNTADLGDDCAEEKGTMGPRNASPENLAALKAGKGYTFRLTDDDGIWYYRGRIVFTEDGGPPVAKALGQGWKPGSYCVAGGLDGAEFDTGSEFGPLEDWGTPNAGCVNIEYRCKIQDPDEDAAPGDMIPVWAGL